MSHWLILITIFVAKLNYISIKIIITKSYLIKRSWSDGYLHPLYSKRVGVIEDPLSELGYYIIYIGKVKLDNMNLNQISNSHFL